MNGRYEKILVVNGPSPPGYISQKDSMGGFGQLFPEGGTIFPPLDLVYLGSYLIDKGMPAEILESLALKLSKEGLVHRVRSSAGTGERALVALRTSAPTLDWDLGICAEMKRSMPDLEIAIYGNVVPHVRWRVEEDPSLDYVVDGEPDDTIYELALGNPLEAILGLGYRKDGGWTHNATRPMRFDLDALPFPKWELLPYKEYKLPASSTRGDVPYLPMLSSRGCPIGCHYCPYPVGQGLKWRKRSAENVVDEMQHLVEDLGIRYVLLRDPMFSFNQLRVREICDEIVSRRLDVEWKCETRVDFLKEPTLRAMAAAGCTGVNFGVESSDVEIQKGVGRAPIEQEKFRATIALCRELGIDTFAFFIIGLPGDTVTSVLKTIRFAIEMQPTWVQFTAASPFIGTKLRDWALERGLTTPDKYAYISSHAVQMGNENLSERDVQSLLKFGQFFQRNLINRGGVLKNHRAPGRSRRMATVWADAGSRWGARAAYSVGSRVLERTIPQPG
jgi:uncharacterized radical SAM superfamily protein